MLIKNMDYIDYSGTEVHETLRFNLSVSELAGYMFDRHDASPDRNLSDKLLKIVTTESMSERVDLLTNILDKAYGAFFEDTGEFIKTPEFLRVFKRSGAYYALMVELAYDVNSACTFVMGLMPNVSVTMDSRTPEWTEEAASVVVNAMLAEVTNKNSSEDDE